MRFVRLLPESRSDPPRPRGTDRAFRPVLDADSVPDREHLETARSAAEQGLAGQGAVNLTDDVTDIRIHKFGGTSVADTERIRHATGLVLEGPGPGVVVVSAVAGTTDRLEGLWRMAREGSRAEWQAGLVELEALHLGLARELSGARANGGPLEGDPAPVDPESSGLREVVERIRASLERAAAGAGTDEDADLVAAAGEDLSVRLFATALRSRGAAAEVVDARDVVRTEVQGARAIPRDEETYRLARAALRPLVERGVVPVIQGYIGATAEGRTTTLGRGGSDFTAAIIGAALGAPEVTIWTDVEGIRSGDPRIVPHARLLPELGFEEAVELAYFGARVIHPAAAKHAAARHVSLRIRSSFRPEGEGTLIRADRREGPAVAAVVHRGGVALITVRSRPLFMAHGFLARVFGVLAGHAVPVDLVATSHTSTAFTIDRAEDLTGMQEELERFAEVTIRRELATVTVVGRGLLGRPGNAGAVFTALGEHAVHLISQASDVSLSFLVDEEKAHEVVRRVHRELIEKGGDG